MKPDYYVYDRVDRGLYRRRRRDGSGREVYVIRYRDSEGRLRKLVAGENLAVAKGKLARAVASRQNLKRLRSSRTATHGARSKMLVSERSVPIADSLRLVVPGATPADETSILLLATILARIELATEWLDEHGIIDDAGYPRPVLKTLSAWENTASRLVAQLGLSPGSRALLAVAATKLRSITQGAFNNNEED